MEIVKPKPGRPAGIPLTGEMITKTYLLMMKHNWTYGELAKKMRLTYQQVNRPLTQIRNCTKKTFIRWEHFLKRYGEV